MRGCADADMTRVMVENGFDPLFSQHAVSIVRSMTERVKGEVASLGADYKAEPIRLPSGGRVRAHDRDVDIVFTLSNPNVAVIEGLLSDAECDKLIQLTSRPDEELGGGGSQERRQLPEQRAQERRLPLQPRRECHRAAAWSSASARSPACRWIAASRCRCSTTASAANTSRTRTSSIRRIPAARC